MTPEEQLVNEARRRYLHDAEFYNNVNRAVFLAVPKTINDAINKAMRAASIDAASIALILQERNSGITADKISAGKS